MKINVLTLFPEMFSAVTGSILGKAAEKGILEFNFINIRDFSREKRDKADEYPFGGGPGMVMLADPIFNALESIEAEGKRILYMSPRGRLLNEESIKELAGNEELTILCGHYEGVDQRVLDYWNMEEVSIGDYVLTGGELPAMVLIDAVARLIPGVLAGEESAMEESIYSGLLEYPQYTKPRSYRGMDVPEVLLNGNHKLIHLWKFEESLKLTRKVRPDLFERFLENHGELTKDEQKVLEKVLK
ncbi:MAG: tRNA (guanosine(37)-N1)-methyltransferase TrmD [Eubacteriaceae bacterium]|nr:tRNA (guanosine(37)-N1)-methyltransferase TrmD [Eubacteriaceae bacterium]